MPGAPDGRPDDQPFGEGASIVRARRAKGANLGALSDEHDRLAVCMPEEWCVLGQVGHRDTAREVRAREFGLVCHLRLPSLAPPGPDWRIRCKLALEA